MKNILPRITEITRRRILTGVAVVAFSGAALSPWHATGSRVFFSLVVGRPQ
jgi:hypothetical protein